MIDVWVNKGSGWNIESVESQYITFCTFKPLSGSSYINLPVDLKSPRKGLINIKNKDQKCFLWCHVRHINHPGRITKNDKKLSKNLIMMELSFQSKKRILTRLK